MKKYRIGFKDSSLIIFGKKIHLIWVALFAIFIYFLYVTISKTNDNNKLIENGIKTKAIVTYVRKVGGKGVIRCSYSFTFNNETYTGSVDDDYYKVGDTITVSFLEKNPETNRDVKFLDKIK